jgi:nucleolar MIF4G domain-containing protein 1
LTAGDESDENGFDMSDLDDDDGDQSEGESDEDFDEKSDGLDSDEVSEDGEDDLSGAESEDVERSEGSSDQDSGDLLDEEEPWNGIAEDTGPAVDVAVAPAAAEPTKYIPPHLRAAALAEKAAGDAQKIEERRKLERKTQGLLNKSVSVASQQVCLTDSQAERGKYREHIGRD